MKTHLSKVIQISAAHLLVSLTLIFGLGADVTLTGCKKARLFVKGDTLDVQPSQFHFFNAFTYDSTLSFSIDGLARETVGKFKLSEYYPTSSSFNLTNGQPNSKLININDPYITSQFANKPDNSTFTFQPNTSYIVFPTYQAYDTATAPLRNTVPRVNYFPEDIYHPYDGTTGIRLINMVAGTNGISLSISPHIGQGTNLILRPLDPNTQPAKASDSYTTTQKGLKKLTLSIGGFDYRYPTVLINFVPFDLKDGKNYSFFAVGDAKNYQNNLQPLPKLYMMEDGVPNSLKELTVASTAYGGAYGDYASVTVVNGAYNIPGLVGGLKSFLGIGIRFNSYTTTVQRWPISSAGGEDINLEDTYPYGVPGMQQRVATMTIPPGQYLVTNTPNGAYSPVYDQFNQIIESSLFYTMCLLPDNANSQKMGHLVMENDIKPDPKLFKLRFINIMGGTTQIDIHNGSPSGPVIASAIPYGEETPYITFQASQITQNLYVTAAGSTEPLFQTGKYDTPIPLPFNGGNSGTLFFMGLNSGLPYSGDPGYFKPYVYYRSDAYTNLIYSIPSAQIYYQL
ncbi:MAG: hypothetical protein J0H74_09260 [Chitinophagaceae bacterium]|nr:hypothetical protein [Chitinophagaceae bacterium]